jgi:F-type H+-transporting ATPase subunit a
MSAGAEEAGGKIVEALHELNVQTLIPIPKVWQFDFSITNAVVYLWVSAVIVFVLFYIAARRARNNPDGLQTLAEILIGFASGHLCGQIGEKGKKYYYYILTLFTFIIVTNLIGLIPKPFLLKGYTPTANINVTFALAMVTFVLTHYLGVKHHGHKYIREFMTPPGLPPVLGKILNVIFVPVEIMGAIFKPLSLSVRLFANTIAGHLLILVMIGLLLEFAGAIILPAGLFVIIMNAFEVFVAFIQAYIFALLSTVYLETAIYGSH